MNEESPIIPLDKLISRLIADLKLAEASGNPFSSKNKKKSSALFYLLEFKAMQEERIALSRKRKTAKGEENHS